MELTEILTAIANVGFPIVCCVVLFKLQGNLNNTLKDLAVTLATMNVRIDNIENALVKKGAINDSGSLQ